MTDFTTNIDMNVRMMNEKLRVDRNFDILQRDVLIGGKRTHFYFIDGFVQEETIEKLVQFFYSLKESDIKDIDTFLEVGMPYTEIEKNGHYDEVEKMEFLQMDPSYMDRDLNVGFSGGEKKKAEILQLLMLEPSLAILDETDSGLDVDAVKTVSLGVEEYQKTQNGALLIITHSTRILEALKVDYTHVLVNGNVVATGDSAMIDDINENGFERFIR